MRSRDPRPFLTFPTLATSHAHLRSVCMTYLQHACFSLSLARRFAFGAFGAVVHALVPSLFVTSSTDCAEAVRRQILSSGCKFPSPEYQTGSYDAAAHVASAAAMTSAAPSRR